MRNLFTPIYWLLFFAVVGLLGLALWSIGSEAGSRWLLEKATALKPGVVEISGVHGPLAATPRFDHIAIDAGGQWITLDGITLDYHLAPLTDRRLHIRRLAIDSIHWRLPQTKRPAKKPPELPTLQLPFDALIDELTIGRLTIENAAGKRTELRDLRLRGAFRRDRFDIDALRLAVSDFDIAADGTIHFSEPPLARLALTAHDADGNRTEARIEGRLQAYRLDAKIDTVARGKLPPAAITLSGDGGPASLAIDSLEAETMDGTIVANGKLFWQGGFRAEASFSGNGIDPGVIDPYYRGRISFGGQATFAGGRLNTQFAVLGKVQGYQFQIETDADLERQKLRFRRGRLVMGPNLLKFTGSVTKERAEGLTFHIDMPKLAALLPQLQGRIGGSGQLDGRWENPQGRIELDVAGLRWRGLSLTQLQAKLNSTGRTRAARYELTAIGLTRGALRLDDIHIRGELSETRQTARLRLHEKKRSLDLSLLLDGRYDAGAKRWQGRLDEMQLGLLGLPRYRQQHPSAISIDRDTLQLEKTCLSDGGDQLCFDADLSRTQPLRATLALQHFALRHLEKWLPLTKYLRETVSARLEIGGTLKQIEANTAITLDADNRLAAHGSFAPEDGAISAQIDGRFDRLKWIEPVSEGLMEPSGKVTIAATVGGTLQQPDIRGSITLKNGSVRLPAAGIRLTDIDIEASTDDARSATISGRLRSGKGRIDISGKASWPSLPEWRATLRLTGDRFQAADLPMAKLWVSPKLDLTARRDRIDVSGELFVPEADLRFKRLPASAMTPSEDTYFLDAENAAQRSRMKVYSRIVLRLGDEVHLSGFGLNARLAGKLVITEAPGQAISGDGSLKVVDGHYEALGQKLEIERGELYWNGPFNSPRLNLRAVRKAEGITTGLEIRGSIQKPESRIFSDPVMDETNALAYLITGKPLGATSESDSNMLLTAVARLGLKGSATLIDDLRRRAGLDLLAIQPGEDLEQSTLVIGKYLSARFYLEYTTSLFEDSSVLSMRYKLNRYLQFEAESSDKRQAIDLIYQIEH